MVESLSHITLIASNLDRMELILTTVFRAKRIYDSGEDFHSLTKERFYDVSGTWIAVMEGQSHTDRSYNHIAFKIDDRKFEDYLKCVYSLGLEVRPSRPRKDGEARSIYFYDFDNHLFELHTGTLMERLTAYANLRSNSVHK